jgi:bacillithiol biosynthesis deacetylase BshB1
MNSCDILCFAPHPDDAELCCGGLLLKAKHAGRKLVVVDITRGEMGTRGTPAIREREAAAATRLLKLHARENLGLPDGHLHDDDTLRVALVNALRKYRPKLLLIPHWEDQHPDHAAVCQAGLYAAWLCGAPRYAPETAKGVASAGGLPYRPARVLHYNNRYGIQADLVVDITNVIEEKMKLVGCFQTQFGAGQTSKTSAKENQTRLSSPRFMEWLKGMHSFYGYQVGVEFGEAYCVKGPLGISGVDAVL